MMIDRIDRLGVSEGDVLLLHIDRPEITTEQARFATTQVGDALKALGLLERVQVIICLRDIDLRKMPESEMARHGWVRAVEAGAEG